MVKRSSEIPKLFLVRDAAQVQSQVILKTCCEQQAAVTESSGTGFCPRPGVLNGWRCSSDSQADTKTPFQPCRGVTMSVLTQRRDSGVSGGAWDFSPHRSPCRLCGFSTDILPERSSPWVPAERAGFTAISLCSLLCLKLNSPGQDASPLLLAFLLAVKSLFWEGRAWHTLWGCWSHGLVLLHGAGVPALDTALEKSRSLGIESCISS